MSLKCYLSDFGVDLDSKATLSTFILTKITQSTKTIFFDFSFIK